MKFLPWSQHFSRLFVLIGLLASAAGCVNDTEPGTSQIIAEFANAAGEVTENEGSRAITLSFSQPIPSDGEIIVKATAIGQTCFQTAPVAELGRIKLPVTRGDRTASFNMLPTDNRALDGSKIVTFSIVSVSNVFVLGPSSQMVVTVLDDEAPVSAGFTSSSVSIRENATTGSIEINLANPAPADGVLVLKLESTSAYGVDYATEPAASDNNIFLPVSEGSSKAMVRVYAVNDQVFRADRNISFKIIDATGGVFAGEKNSLWCTITEDDGAQLSAISAIRAMYTGEPLVMPGDMYVEGIVTSVDNVSSGRVVVEDGTGALPIQLNTAQVPARGDLILVNVGQGLLHELQGTLEIAQVNNFEKLGEDVLRINKMSLNELIGTGETMQSRTVQLIGVTFTQADGTATFGGDRTVTDGDHQIIVRTGAGIDFASELIPSGTVSVTGIIASYDGQFVLYPQEFSDIKKGAAPIRPLHPIHR